MAAVEISVDEERLQGLFQSYRPLARLLEEICNQVLEAEISDHLGADPHERTDSRRGWRNGHHERCLTTRVGTLELPVPRSRDESFSTKLFERYQRSEKALDQRPHRGKPGGAEEGLRLLVIEDGAVVLGFKDGDPCRSTAWPDTWRRQPDGGAPRARRSRAHCGRPRWSR